MYCTIHYVQALCTSHHCTFHSPLPLSLSFLPSLFPTRPSFPHFTFPLTSPHLSTYPHPFTPHPLLPLPPSPHSTPSDLLQQALLVIAQKYPVLGLKLAWAMFSSIADYAEKKITQVQLAASVCLLMQLELAITGAV